MNMVVLASLLLASTPTTNVTPATPATEPTGSSVEVSSEARGEEKAEAEAVLERFRVRGLFFGELAARRMGLEVGLSYEALPKWHFGPLLTVGEYSGFRLFGERRWDLKHVDPVAQLRLIFHPTDRGIGFGAGLGAGVSRDLGPGRFLLTGVAEYYGQRSGFVPYALALMGGYEVDVGKLFHRQVLVRERHVTLREAPVLKGRFLNLDDQPVAAQLTIRRVDDPRKPSPVVDMKNEFELKVAPGEYELQARAPGYLRRGRTIRVNPGDVVVYDMVLRPMPSTKAAKLGENEINITQMIQFEFNKATVLPQSHFILDEVADILLQNPQLKVSVEGHTDDVGGTEFNLKLSEARAKAVATYLVEQGIYKKRLSGRGFGKTQPLINEATDEARAKNRRVEFRISR